MALNAVVKGKEKDHSSWKEVADLISASATGSSFDLPRECEVGTLVSLMIPLPASMRCYDHDKGLYRVWGLVQHCSPMAGNDPSNFHLGVAFIGKNPPESYKTSPNQHYRISGVNENGMWRVEEAKREFRKRAHVRFWQRVELYLALVDTTDGTVDGERTVAENISQSGAAVFTTLDVDIGDRVKFISEEYDFSGLAVICNRQRGHDGRMRLHLSFVENTFPVERLTRVNRVVAKA